MCALINALRVTILTLNAFRYDLYKCFNISVECWTAAKKVLMEVNVDDVFKFISLYENWCILIRISLKFNTKPALVQIMAWFPAGDKPSYEPILAQFTYAYLRHSASMS